jgi:hypothetical protein
MEQSKVFNKGDSEEPQNYQEPLRTGANLPSRSFFLYFSGSFQNSDSASENGTVCSTVCVNTVYSSSNSPSVIEEEPKDCQEPLQAKRMTSSMPRRDPFQLFIQSLERTAVM